MSELAPGVRLALFGAGLLVLLAAAVGVGRLTGDVADAGPAAAPSAPAGDEHGDDHAAGRDGAAGPVGTTSSAGGFRLEAATASLPAYAITPFSFRVLDAEGRAVLDPDVEQERPLHLLVVSRDLSRLAHVHPEVDAAGTWSVPLYLAPGSYRAVADLVVDGERVSLGTDVSVPGEVPVRPLPDPADEVTVGGVTVSLERDGEQVTATARDASGAPLDPEPYLGERGHLTGFRAGDLAYVHAHATGADGAATTYDLPFPGPGSYRLFLEVRTGGTVRTFPFTVEVGA